MLEVKSSDNIVALICSHWIKNEEGFEGKVNYKVWGHGKNNNNNNDLLEKDGGTKNCIYNDYSVWHSSSRQCILTAIKSLYHNKLD